VTQARTTTLCPTWADNSAMRTNGAADMTLVWSEWRGACAPPRIPNERADRCGLVGGTSRAEPSMLHGGFIGLKGGTVGPLLLRFITRTIPLCT
jgi:hypothetical protein